jgi:hypothetical protein
MYCYNCGTELPDAASYCPVCGKGQTGEAREDRARWESCEIMARWKTGLISDAYHFEAEAIGPHGPYVAARSREWKEIAHTPRWRVLDSANERAAEIVKELISDLIKDGWESTGERGSNWENYRFRRLIRAAR